MNKKSIMKKVILSGMFLSLAMVLPLLTGQLPEMGNMLSPMHIPVFLCGFLCGPFFGAAVGFVAPLMRFAIFGMPEIFPRGIAMAFELMAYGSVCGALYKALPKKTFFIYVSLICAMFFGRVAWGAVHFFISGLSLGNFTFEMFLAGAFFDSIPAIILHIVLVPAVVVSVEAFRRREQAAASRCSF